jgi:hypothetical protein
VIGISVSFVSLAPTLSSIFGKGVSDILALELILITLGINGAIFVDDIILISFVLFDI